MSKRTLVLYVPVIHQGYIEFFRKHANSVQNLYILGSEFVDQYKFLVRELRAIRAEDAAILLRSLQIFSSVEIITPERHALLKDQPILSVDESMMHRFFAAEYPENDVLYKSWFLRWDEAAVSRRTDVVYDTTSISDNDIGLMAKLFREATKSSDWWRQVGVCIKTNNGNHFFAHNEHLPAEQSQYVHGDIRDFIAPGTKSDICGAIHAEKNAIAQAAKQGIALKDSSIYVTVFPCSDCARMIVKSGISKVYYATGHATFDGAEVLRSAGVTIIYVPFEKK